MAITSEKEHPPLASSSKRQSKHTRKSCLVQINCTQDSTPVLRHTFPLIDVNLPCRLGKIKGIAFLTIESLSVSSV